jgi:hypothetical protein
MLSSDILESQFGPTQVKILFQDENSRIIQTVAQASGKILEVSWVVFNKTGIEAFPTIHRAILEGGSIGKCFVQENILFKRDSLEVTQLLLPSHFSNWFGSSKPAHMVDVGIYVGYQNTPYCRILETYSPSVKWPEAVSAPSISIQNKIGKFSRLLHNLSIGH